MPEQNQQELLSQVHDLQQQLAAATEQNRQQHRALQEDLRMACQVQQALLDRQYMQFPEKVPAEECALRFYYRYVPAVTLACDFFNVFTISDHEVGVVVCDVMGHGTRASLLALLLRDLMGQLTPLAADPGTFLENLNAGLAAAIKQYEHGVFATAFYMVVDIREGVVRYSNAGHPDPMVIWSNQRVVTQLNGGKQKKKEPALGLVKDYTFTSDMIKIAENDILFCFTDGVYEVMNREGRTFGRSRLQALTREKCVLGPDSLLEEILLETRRFAGTDEVNDDICLLSMQVRKPQETIQG